MRGRLWFRRWAKWRAKTGGYFWMPCPRCKRRFSGLEWGRWGYPSVPKANPEDDGWLVEQGVCRLCAVELGLVLRHG